MSTTEMPSTRTLSARALDSAAMQSYSDYTRCQFELMRRRGMLPEALAVLARIMQETLHSGEVAEFYSRSLPYASHCELVMRGVTASIENPNDSRGYILSKMGLGYKCLVNHIKEDEENISDPFCKPLAYVDLGTHPDLIALCDEIEQKVQPVNDDVIQLLLPYYQPSEVTTAEVHTVTVEELGFPQGEGGVAIVEAARECGLDLLPIDAPLLLLMRPLRLFGEDPYVVMTEEVGHDLLYIHNTNKGLDLSIYSRHNWTGPRFGPRTRLIFRKKYL